eukprot:scaffold7366_cov254-Pinguiococcus_pyrenoidosus.AAC.25
MCPGSSRGVTSVRRRRSQSSRSPRRGRELWLLVLGLQKMPVVILDAERCAQKGGEHLASRDAAHKWLQAIQGTEKDAVHLLQVFLKQLAALWSDNRRRRESRQDR